MRSAPMRSPRNIWRELSELQKNFSKAVEYYLDAFVLPENGPGGAADRRLIRDNLGNVWREVHGSDTGLGDAILGAYDHTQSARRDAEAHDRNRDARDALSFTLRQLDGTPSRSHPIAAKLWCSASGPRGAGPAVNSSHSSPMSPQVTRGGTMWCFLAVNTDEDEARVRPFVDEQKWKVPVVFADGLG